METRFIILYQEVRPIVLKLRQSYQLQLWDQGDWDQEGMLVLYQLISQKPELSESRLIFPYFKTKFSNYVKDQLRKQESQKRRFNKLSYEEVGDVAHCIPSGEMLVSDKVIYEEMLSYIESHLTSEEKELMGRVMSGECFSGRAAFVRKLKELGASYERG